MAPTITNRDITPRSITTQADTPVTKAEVDGSGTRAAGIVRAISSPGADKRRQSNETWRSLLLTQVKARRQWERQTVAVMLTGIFNTAPRTPSVPPLRRAGPLSPRGHGMVGASRLFRHVLDRKLKPYETTARLPEAGLDTSFCNSFHHGHAWIQPATTAAPNRA